MDKVVVFWFRRDLRLEDNCGLNGALESNLPVLPLFIFDNEIIDGLESDDSRISFIYKQLEKINLKLQKSNSSIIAIKGKVENVFKSLISKYNVQMVFANEDYEPYANSRDESVKNLLDEYGIDLKLYQDHVVFRPGDILKDDGKPYTVYTPFKNKWLRKLNVTEFPLVETLSNGIFYNSKNELPSLYSMGFEQSLIEVDDYKLDGLSNYEQERNLPAVDGTSKLGPHLRFGTVSIRSVVNSFKENPVLLSEIIWREFFIHILHHFPYSITRNFKVKYDSVKWLNNKGDFKKWCEGKTGYPIVDAGIRQLIQTGNMHNRVRMVVASFLCKHLLIDWRWGEAFFAKHLLDYELSSNVGNWQWVAGTGCDSAPYFRVFNPMEQQRKFDGAGEYIRKWVKDIDELTYPLPMVDHKMARSRAVETYKIGLS